MDITLTVPRLNETKQKLHKKPGAPSNKWPASYCWGKYGNTYELSLGQSPDLLGKASSVYERKKHSEAWQTQARGFGEKGSEPRPGWCVGGAEPVGNSGERERDWARARRQHMEPIIFIKNRVCLVYGAHRFMSQTSFMVTSRSVCL